MGVGHEVLLVHHFLEAPLCETMRNRYRGGEAALVTRANGATSVDENARRTLSVAGDRQSLAELAPRLAALKPGLEERFETPLSGFQNPHFLCYRAGDFFRAHLDNANDPRQPIEITSRRVAIVIFLNGQSVHATDGKYRGGELVFYNPTAPSPDRTRILLRGEQGLLVAFAANHVHEVLPVLQGRRFTLVTWYV